MDKNKTYTKIDANTIQITDSTPNTLTTTFVYNDLVGNLNSLLQQKQDFNTTIDAQIADAENAVAQADQLGIVALPVITPPINSQVV